jgi:hypothetical protein
VAEPETSLALGVPSAGNDFRSRLGVLDVKREFNFGPDLIEQLEEGRDMFREFIAPNLRNRPSPDSSPDDAVVIKNSTSIGSDPHIALQSRGTETESEAE